MAEEEAKSAVREEFSKLNLDGKTSFLVEAVFSTAGAAINEIGERLTSLVELVTGPQGETASGHDQADAPDAPTGDPGPKDAGKKSK